MDSVRQDTLGKDAVAGAVLAVQTVPHGLTSGLVAGNISARRLHFGGFIGWVVWPFIRIGFLTGWRNRIGALFGWGYAFTRGLRRERGFTIGDMAVAAYSSQAESAASILKIHE